MDEDEALAALARARGIETEWWDWQGRKRLVSPDTLRALLTALGTDPSRPDEVRAAHPASWSLPPLLTAEAGEVRRLAVPTDADGTVSWRIVLDSGECAAGVAEVTREAEKRSIAIALPTAIGEGVIELSGAVRAATRIAVCPRACFLGPLERERLWGLAVQVYGLRAAQDGGLGHYGALAEAARAAARAGADALMLSPTHALFAADPAHVSPYAPSSRAQADGRLVDPGALPEVARLADLIAATGLAEELAALESLPLVDYARAVPARLSLLRALFARFATACPAGSPLADEFAAFVRAGGESLRRHAVFEALHAARYGIEPAQWDWRTWPAPLRDPAHPEVERFARENDFEVSFHLFLQWLAERGLAAAQRAAQRAGMRIGLIADLAVGQHPGGSRAWARAGALLEGVGIGAPPDALNHLGQGWGLTTFAPTALVKAGFAPFREELRAAMRHAGGIRLDHVMGLSRIWCIPDGARPDEGAYLRFPKRDLLNLLALESVRAGAIVIGEDLGTVEAGLREELARRGVLGLRVLFFQRDRTGAFLPPDRYDARAIAMTTTHDLATLAGWWRGIDIDLRAPLGLLGEELGEATARTARQIERAALWHVLQAHASAAGDPPAPDGELTRLGIAAARFLGRTPSALALLPIEDAILSPDQVNLPGTVAEHPNWRRRLPAPLGDLLARDPPASTLGALRAERDGLPEQERGP